MLGARDLALAARALVCSAQGVLLARAEEPSLHVHLSSHEHILGTMTISATNRAGKTGTASSVFCAAVCTAEFRVYRHQVVTCTGVYYGTVKEATPAVTIRGSKLRHGIYDVVQRWHLEPLTRGI